jgi:PEP-CTERM motif-containing protein
MPNQLLRGTSARCLPVPGPIIRASLFAVCSLLIAIRPGPADASVTTFTDSAAYFAAAGPQSLQDFNSPISVTPGTSTASITYPNLVVSCTATAVSDCSRSFALDSNIVIDGYSIRSNAITELTFTFNSPITSFGVFIAGLGTILPGSATLSISDSNGFSTDLFVNYSSTFSGFDHALFAGLISSDRFTSVTFVDSEIGDGINFDNLSYGHAVPEPSTLILMLTGIGGLSLFGWFKKSLGKADHLTRPTS